MIFWAQSMNPLKDFFLISVLVRNPTAGEPYADTVGQYTGRRTAGVSDRFCSSSAL